MGCCPKSLSLASLFAALADNTRLRLLNLMAGREVCVCYFVEILGQGQPKISRHLAYLRRAGIVAARREGKWMHYCICPPADAAAASILSAVLAFLGRDELMQTDRAKLDRACCAPSQFVVLAGAPRPVPVAPRAKSLRRIPRIPAAPGGPAIHAPGSAAE
jgi:ArsR family transcriptional regulator, arsenate/arsenite/antimonite-responsive transcriptional repressor